MPKVSSYYTLPGKNSSFSESAARRRAMMRLWEDATLDIGLPTGSWFQFRWTETIKQENGDENKTVYLTLEIEPYSPLPQQEPTSAYYEVLKDWKALDAPIKGMLRHLLGHRFDINTIGQLADYIEEHGTIEGIKSIKRLLPKDGDVIVVTSNPLWTQEDLSLWMKSIKGELGINTLAMCILPGADVSMVDTDDSDDLRKLGLVRLSEVDLLVNTARIEGYDRGRNDTKSSS